MGFWCIANLRFPRFRIKRLHSTTVTAVASNDMSAVASNDMSAVYNQIVLFGDSITQVA